MYLDGIESDFYFDANKGNILYQQHAEEKCYNIEAPKVDIAELTKKANDP